MKRTLALVLALCMAAGLLAGCGKTEGGAKDTVTVLARYVTDTFDPTAGGIIDDAVGRAIFDTLVRFGDGSDVQPALAESWTLSDDNLTYTFKLREDVKWHDGSGFTADDVVYTLDTMLASTSYMYLTSYITGCEKVDDYTVNVTRYGAYTELLSTLAYLVPIVPKAAHSADPEGFAKKPVGTGAFKLVSQENDGTVMLEANEGYYMGKPAFAKAVVKAPLDSSTAVVALENGEVDLIFGVPAAQLPLVEANDKLTAVKASGFGVMTLSFYDNGLGGDGNLRKAIYHGINRQNVITLATEGTAAEPKDLFSEMTMRDLGGKLDLKGYGEALAKDYLSKSDYVPGTELVISCTSQNSTVAQAIQGDMAKIGVTIAIEQLDPNEWSAKLSNGEVQLNLSGLGAVSASPIDLLFFFESKNERMGLRMGHSDEFDQLIADIRESTDMEEINEKALRAMEIQYELANVVPLYETPSIFAYSKGITGVRDNASTTIFYMFDVKPAN